MTDQERRDQVIKGLECLSDTSEAIWPTKERCEKCPLGYCFFNDGGFETWGCKSQDCARDALALLKEYEPRVMTLEALKSLKISDIVWLQLKGNPEVIAGIVRGRDAYIYNGEAFTMFLQTEGFIIQAMDAHYMIRWCCWTSRPSNEQMEATPWQ